MSASFSDLWKEHPVIKDSDDHPCNGKHDHTNQCAIKLSIALQANNIDMSSFKGAFCFNDHGREHPIRAKDVGKWLANQERTFGKPTVAKRSKKNPIKVHTYVGKTGIVMCLHFKGVDEPSSTFNHIDLWDGNQAADRRFGAGYDVWIERSDEVWYWKIA